MNKAASALLALLGLACSGGSDCMVAPCPLPMALSISVTAAASGAPVTTAVVNVTGRTLTTEPCNGTCDVPGYAGSYEVDISAPGFTTAHRSIEVQGTNPACGCATVTAQRVAIALLPS